MYSFREQWLCVIALVLFTFKLQCISCKAITPTDTRFKLSTLFVEEAQPTTALLQSIDSKAKLDDFNRALYERLQQTRTNLRPLQARAAQLQHAFDVFQRTNTGPHPARAHNAERKQLLQQASRLRAAVERRLRGFGALDQRYRTIRTLLDPKPKKNVLLPRAWLDRDTERQMELNERVYKNIIDLLVHLIECPVNIIHDVLGHENGSTVAPSTTTESTTPYQGGEDGEEEGNGSDDGLYDEAPVELNADIGTVPWLEEFHY